MLKAHLANIQSSIFDSLGSGVVEFQNYIRAGLTQFYPRCWVPVLRARARGNFFAEDNFNDAGIELRSMDQKEQEKVSPHKYIAQHTARSNWRVATLACESE